MGESTSLHLLDGRTSAHALTYGMLRASRTLELDDQLLQFILATDADMVTRLLGSQSVLGTTVTLKRLADAAEKPAAE